MGDESDIIRTRSFRSNDRDGFSADLNTLVNHVLNGQHGFSGTSTTLVLRITNSEIVVCFSKNKDVFWKRELYYDRDAGAPPEDPLSVAIFGHSHTNPPPSGHWLVANFIGKCIATPHETLWLKLGVNKSTFSVEEAQRMVAAMKRNRLLKAIHIVIESRGMFTPEAWTIVLAGIAQMTTLKTLSVYGRPLIGQWTLTLIDPDWAASIDNPPMKHRPRGCCDTETGNALAEAILVRAVIPSKSIRSLNLRNIGFDDSIVNFIVTNVVHRLSSVRLAVNNITEASASKLEDAIRRYHTMTSCLLKHNPLLSQASQDKIDEVCSTNNKMQKHMERLFHGRQLSSLSTPTRFLPYTIGPVISSSSHVFNILRNVDLVRMQVGPQPSSCIGTGTTRSGARRKHYCAASPRQYFSWKDRLRSRVR